MEMANDIPTGRRNGRRQQSELQVCQAYADSPEDGIALYSMVPPGGSEIDVIAWHVGHVRMAIAVKGGICEYINGMWQHVCDNGAEAVTCQVSKAFDGALALHRFLKQHEADHSPYVVSALVLPDMPPGHAIERLCGQAIVVCGLEDLVQRVKAQAVERHTIHFPPTWVDARRESQLLLAGQPEPERPSATGGGVPGGVAGLLQDRGIYIERVENLHLDVRAATDIPA